ncbi:hypothetical protein BOX15_Mlig028128g1 [Macrostomum lignano]|uniref:Metallophos domain-containing protein n=2 Tax=Macrostomum lignano TaxID=282301 RepID=A0A1I8J9V2_9PLAT|nr:hypothetical protein BOX15_Mlig028128g1 [Macrostomum lignano]
MSLHQSGTNYYGIREHIPSAYHSEPTVASTTTSSTKSDHLLRPVKRLFHLKQSNRCHHRKNVFPAASEATANSYMNGSLQHQQNGSSTSQEPPQDLQVAKPQEHLMAKPQVYVVGSPNPKSPFLRIAHVSDTCDLPNNGLSAVFEADVLVHSGNLCSYQFRKHFFKDTEFLNQIKAINNFFADMPHRYKIFVPGPNEIFFDSEDRERVQALLPNCIYLQDSECVIEGVRFYGVPWSANRRGTVGRGFGKSVTELKTVWSNVPDNVDVLISHSVPTNSLYDDLVLRLKPKMFLYGSRMQRSSRSDQAEENCVKFKDNVIFSNGHAGNASKRGIFDFYADDQTPRVTCLPVMPSEADAEAQASLLAPRSRSGLLRCILS